jgi:hypothetical protein
VPHEQAGPERSRLPWAVRIFGPVPGLKEINLVCWGLFVAFLVIPLGVLLWLQLIAGSGALLKLHPDFIYFYGIGRIANEYPIARLYDYALQLKIFNEIFPLKDGSYGPSPYPPFVAMFFRLFAQMPFEPAYFLWGGLTLILYLGGITCAIRDAFPAERLKVSLFLCFSLAFYPFIVSTWINGQLSAVAVASVGLALFLERRSSPFCSGLALSVLAYKPTLLLLIVPMLLLTRKLRALAGLTLGGISLILLATAFAGTQIWPDYAHFLSSFGQAAGLGSHSYLQLWKYVDFHSFTLALPGGSSRPATIILSGLIAIIAIWLVALLWRSAKADRPAQDLAWAATLTWSLLLNVYVPIYDTVLVVLAILLTLTALRDLESSAVTRWTVLLALTIFGISWIAIPSAKVHGIQWLTPLLTILGLVQLQLLRRATRQTSLRNERRIAS